MSTGSSSSSSSARVSIPSNVRKTIHDIREITGKLHGDDEIYAVLKECSMDPNETIQKLLYLDTFHEVKSRRDRRKDIHNGKASEERPPMGVQRRGSRGGGHGTYGSNFSSDAGGRRNGGRRENGGMPFSHRARNSAPSRAPRALSTALPNGTATLPNGHAQTYLSDSEAPSLTGVSRVGPALPEPGVTEQEKCDRASTVVGLNSALDSLSAPSLLGPYSGGVTMVKVEVRSQKSVAETNHIDETNVVFEDNNIGSGQPESDKVVVDEAEEESWEEEKIPSKPLTPESPKTVSLSSREVVVPEVAAITARVSSLSMNGSNASYGQHVTFPNHFQVPEALKTGLTFGSFDVSFGPKGELINACVQNGDTEKTSQKDNIETVEEPMPISDHNVAVSVVEGGYFDNSQPLTHPLSNFQPLKVEQQKQEAQFLHDGTQNQIFSVPSYLGLMAPMIGSQLMPFEGLETQGHDSHIPIYANGNALVPPSTNPSPPLPTSMAVSPQSVPVYRQAYPPNFFPYGQYISPYYIPPMHQYLGHNGFAPQPTTGNMYIPQPAQPSGVKFSLPQFKPGTTSPNPAHIGVQPVGSFIAGPVGYPQQVSSGSSMGTDELVGSHLKESQIYTTGQLTEGTGVWLHTGPGQEIPTYQMNSMYSLAPPPPPHHHHQPHIAFATMFPPGPAMTAPSALLQQQPTTAAATGGPIEAIGPPPPPLPGPAYQQQPQQISWNNTTAF